jgi:hypothetical protein
MRRIVLGTALTGLLMSGLTSLPPAHADQSTCVDNVHDVAWLCVTTTNSGGIDENDHTVLVTGYESVPMFGLGVYAFVTCDDNGGTEPAVISTDVILGEPVNSPAPCQTLP